MIKGSPGITGSWIPRAPMKGFWWHLHVGSTKKNKQADGASRSKTRCDTVVPGEPSSFNCLSSTDQIERGILLLCHDMSIAFWILLSLTLTSMSWKRLTETLARCRIQTIPVTTSDRLSLDMLASCGSFYPMVSLLLLPLDRSLARETHLEVSSRLLESHACHTSCILKWHATAHFS